MEERRFAMGNNLKDLKMAKKRDHKVLITDEAINKVPRIQYKETFRKTNMTTFRN
jgi:hypothetical protein